MKLSDYVSSFLAERGVEDAFVITGGGAMHLNDSLGHEERIRKVYPHHEQAAAMAAEAYARIRGSGPGVLCVTTGPGGINTMNGVLGAFTDSIPLMVISGQVKRSTCMACNPPSELRQLGDQEVDIIRAVSGITKYAVMVTDGATIRYHLEKAFHLATSGRPGPVWIDIPVDVQAEDIDVESLKGLADEEVSGRTEGSGGQSSGPTLQESCAEVLRRLGQAERPVILAGSGVHLAQALESFRRLLPRLKIPATTGWTAPDLIVSDSPYFCGRPGTVGDRPGNFAVQSSDFLLVLGCRLNIRQVGYGWDDFARGAFLAQVDVDPDELNKPTVRPDLAIEADLGAFLDELHRQLDGDDPGQEAAGQGGAEPAAASASKKHHAWLQWCRDRQRRYPAFCPERHRSAPGQINPYHFCHELIARMAADDVVVCGNATASVVPFQVGTVQQSQRWIANSGSASMGYDLPAAVGAAVARGGGRVFCFAGDGSLQMNIQELQTVVHYGLPITIIVLNNRGYLSMRKTQQGFFGRMSGADPSSGVSFPDYVKVAEAYGMAAMRIEEAVFLPDIEKLLGAEGPLLVEVMLDPDQGFEPRSKARQLEDGSLVSSALDDLFPFLPREEAAEHRHPDASMAQSRSRKE